MGYQKLENCENAIKISIGIDVKDLIYKQAIQRRLLGRLVQYDISRIKFFLLTWNRYL
jgi:hypothetical protein